MSRDSRFNHFPINFIIPGSLDKCMCKKKLTFIINIIVISVCVYRRVTPSSYIFSLSYGLLFIFTLKSCTGDRNRNAHLQSHTRLHKTIVARFRNIEKQTIVVNTSTEISIQIFESHIKHILLSIYLHNST